MSQVWPKAALGLTVQNGLLAVSWIAGMQQPVAQSLANVRKTV